MSFLKTALLRGNRKPGYSLDASKPAVAAFKKLVNILFNEFIKISEIPPACWG
jgi:hypothetical protein